MCGNMGPEEKHQQERKGSGQALTVFFPGFVSPKAVTNQRLKNTFHIVFWRGTPKQAMHKIHRIIIKDKRKYWDMYSDLWKQQAAKGACWDAMLHYWSTKSTRRGEAYLLEAWTWLKLELDEGLRACMLFRRILGSNIIATLALCWNYYKKTKCITIYVGL